MCISRNKKSQISEVMPLCCPRLEPVSGYAVGPLLQSGFAQRQKNNACSVQLVSKRGDFLADRAMGPVTECCQVYVCFALLWETCGVVADHGDHLPQLRRSLSRRHQTSAGMTIGLDTVPSEG